MQNSKKTKLSSFNFDFGLSLCYQSILPEYVPMFSEGIGKKYQPEKGQFLSWQKLLIWGDFISQNRAKATNELPQDHLFQ